MVCRVAEETKRERHSVYDRKTTYVMTDVIRIRRVLSSRVLTVTTVPVSASRRKISTVMCKSEPSLRKVSWGRSSVMKITSATLTCFRLSKKLPGILVGPWSPSFGKTILVPRGMPGLIGIVRIFSFVTVLDLSSSTRTNL